MGRWLVAVWMMLAAALGAPAWAQQKIALVVGISDYKVGAKLSQTLVDAGKVSAALTEVGFSTTTLAKPDLSKAELEAALLAFASRITRDDYAVLYFAGHGMQHGGDNWLIPASAELKAEANIRIEGVALQTVVAVMKQARFRIVILDACRNNPFQVNWIATMTGVPGMGGVPKSLLAEGEMVAFSAAPGQTVPNDGIYADELAKAIATEGLELRQMMDRVSFGVKRRNPAADPRYEVADYGGAFSFRGGYDPDAGATTIDPDEAKALAEIRKRRAETEARKAEAAARKAEAAARRPEAEAAFAAAREGRPVAQREFRDCGNGCPAMVALPTGRFTMGSPPGEEGRYFDEGPTRTVTIGYQIAVGKFEVTWDEYRLCVADGDCAAPADDRFGQGARPVTIVSWYDALAYAVWLSRQTGNTYRLLSEAEWEYAARAVTQTDVTTRWSFGDDEDALGAHAWYYANSDSGTQPVGQKQANAFGLHDLHGNVSEWVEDCYEDYSLGHPPDGRAFTESSCSELVVRGGSWSDAPAWLRAAHRSGIRPKGRNVNLGFRLAREL